MCRNSLSSWITPALVAALVLSIGVLAPPPVQADGGVVFEDIAEGDLSGITYRRQPSPRLAGKEAIEAMSPIPAPDFLPTFRPQSPQKAAGSPGVALLDYDGDGDLDIYVTNGPGAANSLYQNQLADVGSLTFVDVAVTAGAALSDQDSTGVCYGDIDNDGDHDLYVVATGMTNRLLENDGDGTFTDISAGSGAEGEGRHAIGCTMADFDGDSLLDIAVGNSYDDWTHRQPVFAGPETYGGMEHNYLFLNQGGNLFADVSAASGIEDVSNMAGPGLTGAAFTWAIGSADLDLDGDVDLLTNDNQGPPSADDRTLERGWNRIFENDGSANFVDVTEAKGTDVEGGWMGNTFADFNCDGLMDFFATDLGYLRVGANSRWFLQNPDGTFTDPGLGGLIRTPFGWGASSFDYDNDGDWDIVYGGGVDVLSLQVADNPNVVLANKGSCEGEFNWDAVAVQREHRTRSVQGLATGDLNNDGFTDVVSVANFRIQPGNFAPAVPFFTVATGSPFDAIARMEIAWAFGVNPGFATWIGGPDFIDNPPVPGDLSVEINSADNGHRWVSLQPRGGAGILPDTYETNNRDGIGAVLFFTPGGGNTSMKPVDGGASYGSQDGLVKNFGMRWTRVGVAEVLWPGGVRNKLYQVRAGERLTLPEIPCSYDGDLEPLAYTLCVSESLDEYLDAGEISRRDHRRMMISALRAYVESRFSN